MLKREAADYISELACELSRIAQQHGLHSAAFCLCMASLDARQVAAEMKRAMH
jgi:hypothetical protein